MADRSKTAAMEKETKDAGCALRDRVPLALLCCILSFLDQDGHVALSLAASHFRRAALLPQSSCQDITVSPRARSTVVPSGTLRLRPRVVRIARCTSAAFFDAACAWLAHVPQLHTLQIRTMPTQNLSALSAVGSLRHLSLDTPDALALVSALHACGSRLRALKMSRADNIDPRAPVDPKLDTLDFARAIILGAERLNVTTFEQQLATCTLLESLAVQTARGAEHFVRVLGSDCLPALRSLSLVQGTGGTASLAALSSHTNLSLLCCHAATRRICREWPALPHLRTLDLGSTAFQHDDFGAIQCAFPLLDHLRLACDRPEELAGLVHLTDLTIIDAAPSGIDWLDFADRVARLLPLLPGLERLGVQCHRRRREHRDCTWTMSRVTTLSLSLLPANYPRIRAPALRWLRANYVPAQVIVATAAESPRLEHVECCGESPFEVAELLVGVRAQVKGPLRIVGREREIDLEAGYCNDSLAVSDNWL